MSGAKNWFHIYICEAHVKIQLNKVPRVTCMLHPCVYFGYWTGSILFLKIKSNGKITEVCLFSQVGLDRCDPAADAVCFVTVAHVNITSFFLIVEMQSTTAFCQLKTIPECWLICVIEQSTPVQGKGNFIHLRTVNSNISNKISVCNLYLALLSINHI